MSTAGGMFDPRSVKRFVMPNASHLHRNFFGRLGVFAIIARRTCGGNHSHGLPGTSGRTGGSLRISDVASPYRCLLVAVSHSSGVVAGLIAGLIAVTLTESIGAQFMPWGRWPMTLPPPSGASSSTWLLLWESRR